MADGGSNLSAPKKRKLAAMQSPDKEGKEPQENTEPEQSDKKPTTQADIDMLLMDKVERRKLKKQLKKQRENENDPEIELKLENYPGAVKVKDIKDLVLWILADGVNPKWILIKRKFNVKAVVVLMASELSKDLYEDEQNFPKMKSLFSLVCDIQGPGEKRKLASPIQGLLQHQLSKEEKKVFAPESSMASSAKKHDPASILEDLILSSTTMIENKYPLEGTPETAGFVVISGNVSPQKAYKLLAIDCEMVSTKNGLELARISVVDDRLQQVYDTFVLPDDPILDYNTQYSGLTAQMLEGVTTKLVDVQNHLATIISPATVLVGHSLENDLRALKMIHHNVIDTALSYSHTRGPPYKPSLKWLCEKYLNKSIQGQATGHDSIEDAISAMELVNLKLKNGADFGLLHQDCVRLSVKLEHNGRTSAFADMKSTVNSYGQPPAEGKICASDSEVVENVAHFAQAKHFVFGRLTSLESFNRHEEDEGASHPKTLKEVLTEMDDNVAKVYESLPNNVMLIVLSGHGKVAPARRLLAKKEQCKKATEAEKDAEKLEDPSEDLGAPVDSDPVLQETQPPNLEAVWTKKDEQKLEEAIKVGRQGLGFFIMKKPSDQ